MSADPVDIAWLLVCAALVLVMQAGFTALETGLVREKNSINVAIKNFVNFLVAAALFWLFGFGLMFGSSAEGVLGTSLFAFEGDTAFLAALFVFELGFIGTATTLMSGAVAERMRFGAYVGLVVFVALSHLPGVRSLGVGRCRADRGGRLERLAEGARFRRFRWIHRGALGGRLGGARGDHHSGAADRALRVRSRSDARPGCPAARLLGCSCSGSAGSASTAGAPSD